MFPTTPVPITLADGKPRGLRYTLATLRALKEKYGDSFLKAPAVLFQRQVETEIPDIVLAGLVPNDGLDAGMVAELIDGPAIEGVLYALVEAIYGKDTRTRLERAITAVQNGDVPASPNGQSGQTIQ